MLTDKQLNKMTEDFFQIYHQITTQDMFASKYKDKDEVFKECLKELQASYHFAPKYFPYA